MSVEFILLVTIAPYGNDNSLKGVRNTVFSSHEYHYLKELFGRILQVQNAQIIFRKMTGKH